MLDLEAVTSPILDIHQMAKFLEISEAAIYRAVRAGTFRPMPMSITPRGKKLLWRKNEVQTFFQVAAPEEFAINQHWAKVREAAVKQFVTALEAIADDLGIE